MDRDSDLIGIPVALGAILSVVAVLAAFFFIGPVVGIVVLLAVLCLAGWAAARFIGRNDLED